MRKIAIVLGFVFSVIAVLLAVLPFSNFAFIPAIIALAFGTVAFFKAKNQGAKKHTIHLIFLLTIIAVTLATYKNLNTTIEVGDTQKLEQRDEDSLEDSIDELEDIDLTE